MQLKDYDEREGKRVWLTVEEVETLLGTADNTTQKIALGLGVRSGLRCAEIVAVTPNDIVTTPGGVRVRVWEGKGSKYRETPLSRNLYSTVEAFADVRAESDETPLVDVQTRTVERWVKNAVVRCQEETDDVGWQFLTPHDLRRTWGTLLVESEVEPGMVMEWGAGTTGRHSESTLSARTRRTCNASNSKRSTGSDYIQRHCPSSSGVDPDGCKAYLSHFYHTSFTPLE